MKNASIDLDTGVCAIMISVILSFLFGCGVGYNLMLINIKISDSNIADIQDEYMSPGYIFLCGCTICVLSTASLAALVIINSKNINSSITRIVIVTLLIEIALLISSGAMTYVFNYDFCYLEIRLTWLTASAIYVLCAIMYIRMPTAK